MINVSVKTDIDRALRKLHLTKDESRKAIARALSKTATTARAEAARDIRDAGYGLKIGDIKDAISIRRATAYDLKALVRATGRPIPLIQYGARQTKKGVTVNVKNGRKRIAHAFIATMPNGHKGVFVRKGDQHRRVMRNGRVVSTGLPIRELYGPSIPSAFANEVVQRAIASAIRERFPTVLKQELAYLGTLH